MKIKITQKVADIDGKKVAFVATEICDGKYTYPVRFDEKTKKRFNVFAKSNGFVVKVLADGENVPLPLEKEL